MFKRDSTILGIAIGLILPVTVFGILSLLNMLLANYISQDKVILERTMYLVSIFMNLIPLRWYLVTWKLELTGRGILLITFVLMIFFFLIISPLR
jgi:hypothetical protein